VDYILEKVNFYGFSGKKLKGLGFCASLDHAKFMRDEFTKRGLQLENLLVRNITLPASVKAVIEQKINAEQDAQKMQFVLLKEKQEAERKRVEAQGISDYQRIINVGLTDNQLQYEQIKAMKELALSTNAKVIVMGKGNAPIILDSKN
jgi:regulator of protease activity HflC (stomatin/prohibitin superfamily)